MSRIIALVPARLGSKGIQGKNFRRIGDSPMNITALAVGCAMSAGCDVVAVSSDAHPNCPPWLPEHPARPWLHAPAPLHTDTCAMIDVVRDALARVPGEPDDIWVLLQPTQPLRTPAHVRAAIALLQETQADSVVSVTELPRQYHPNWQYEIHHNTLYCRGSWRNRPTRRQDLPPSYRFDGTCYAFRRHTVDAHGNLFGNDVRPLIIPPEETCELDTEADWAALEQRWGTRG